MHARFTDMQVQTTVTPPDMGRGAARTSWKSSMLKRWCGLVVLGGDVVMRAGRETSSRAAAELSQPCSAPPSPSQPPNPNPWNGSIHDHLLHSTRCGAGL